MKRYKVGDSVWVAWTGIENVNEPCQVCFGNRTVDLALGNGDVVTLPCRFCAVGYEAPTGYREAQRYNPGARQKVITGIEIKVSDTGEEIEYSSGHHILYPDRVFDFEAEAVEKCREIADKLELEQRTRLDYIKADVKKSFSWNAGYHLREAKRHERDAAYHREKAKLCKARKGEDKT